MKRTTLNFIIDGIGFAAFLFLTTTGLILRYQLPPGSGGHGMGHPGRSVIVLWGLTRHEWGSIHFWVAVVFFSVLALHLILHFRWIICMFQGKKAEQSGYRLALGALGISVLLLFASMPLLSPPQRTTNTISEPRSDSEAFETHGTPTLPEEITHQDPRTPAENKVEAVRGYLTLQEIETMTGVPQKYILKKLGAPTDTSPHQRMGQLARRHGFNMWDVREFLAGYAKNPEGSSP